MFYPAAVLRVTLAVGAQSFVYGGSSEILSIFVFVGVVANQTQFSSLAMVF
jgi:hypothetical protein